jgi:peroxiredoxin
LTTDEIRNEAQDAESAGPQTADYAAIETEAAVEQPWQVPAAQPLRLIAAVFLLVAGAFSYGYALTNFWSSPALGIHLAIPYPAYLLILLSLILGLLALKVALRLWSPHAKLAIAGLSFLACLTFAIGGGRFVSYTIRGSRNPPFRLHLAVGDEFPDFHLTDQNNLSYDAGLFQRSPLTLVVIYRGDFCPFARFELGELSRNRGRFSQAGVQIIAISADQRRRSAMLAGFLHTSLPLLSDSDQTLLGRLGLVQHYTDGEPDSAIPAFILVDGNRRVRWIFTSGYYRVQPSPELILAAARDNR